MTTAATHSPYYSAAIRDFTDAGVTPDLIEQIAPGPAWDPRSRVGHVYTAPPTTGCAAPRGQGAAGVYGTFDLRAWYTRAPEAWGPDTDAQMIDAAQDAADMLRTVGEGSRVLWCLYALRPGEWRTHPRTALSIESLIQVGPQLDADDLAHAQELLQPAWSWAGGFGWRRQDLLGPDEPVHTRYELHGAAVYSTTWGWEP